jgi:multicomponent Na+:H+ antiporter subunit G
MQEIAMQGMNEPASALEWLQFGASLALIAAGVVFMFVGSLGVVRLPDFYARTHAASKTDTLGIMLVVGGLIVFEGFTLNSFKLLFVLLFVALANPIGSHALARAAMIGGLKPLLFRREQGRAARERGIDLEAAKPRLASEAGPSEPDPPGA